MADISSIKIENTTYNIKDTTARSAASQAQNTADSKISSSLKGAANGVAELDANGLVPSSQLPSFVDDVKEYTSKSVFPSTGETGKIYVAIDTNLTYRWSGSAYVEISPSLALGETSSTAYRGDRGATAFTHATDSNRLTTATASGLYKIASTAQGHILSLTAVTKTDITGLGIPGSDTDRYVNSVAFADYTSSDASKPVKMTLTRAGSDTATVIGYIPKVSSSSAGVAPKGTAVSSQSQSTKFLREDGTWSAPSYTVNTDTKVTSVGNHYAPTADTSAQLSASASGGTAAWSIDVVQGVQLQRDAKGHVTGVTVTSGKIPGNPNTNYYHKTGSWNGLTYTAGKVGSPDDLAFTIPTGTSATTVAVGNHTHKYAGSSSAGGAATSANKLNTDAGTKITPVYFSGGVPVATDGASIPFIVGTGSTAGTWLGSLASITEYYDGLLILYKPSVAGASTTTLNINSLGAKTVYMNNTTKLTTHFPANQPILLVYSANTNSGCWVALDCYDSGNTNTQIRVYRQTTGYNADYPIIVSRTETIGTAGTDGSYTGVYGVVHDTTQQPTVNPSTGEVKAKKLTGDITGNSLTKSQVTTALGYTPPTSDTNTHRPIQMNGTEILGNNTTALNLKAGTNVSLSNSSGTVTITATDTNTWRGIQDNLTSSTNTTESLSAKQGYLLANGSARDSTKLPLAGGTMTGQLITSFKGSVANGSRQSDASTIPDLITDLRYSSGCMGSVSIGKAYTKNGITVPTGWYNYEWIPHRSGGLNGAANEDNCDYGFLYLTHMTSPSQGTYEISYASQNISQVRMVSSFTTAPTTGQVVISDGTRGGVKTSDFTIADNAGFHNSIYRGKSLGTSITTAQWNAISAGTFDDLYIGDYWTLSTTINGTTSNINYVIAAFDYWWNCGDSYPQSSNKHHVVLVPSGYLYTAQMNTSNVTTGGYISSAMYTTNLTAARTGISNLFGDHLYSVRRLFTTAVNASGQATGWGWYTSSVDLMNENMVYGSSVWTTSGYEVGVDRNILPLFLLNPASASICASWWLRSVAAPAYFAGVSYYGYATCGSASYSSGVRPAFAIY